MWVTRKSRHTTGRIWQVVCGDSGSVSVEAALAMSALVIVLVAMAGALVTLGAQLAAVDTAGAAARAAAIGVDFTPERGRINTHVEGNLVTVDAFIPAPLGEVKASVTFPQES